MLPLSKSRNRDAICHLCNILKCTKIYRHPLGMDGTFAVPFLFFASIMVLVLYTTITIRLLSLAPVCYNGHNVDGS